MVVICDSKWRLKGAIHHSQLVFWPHIPLCNCRAMGNLFWSTIPSFLVLQAITKSGEIIPRENIVYCIFSHQECDCYAKV